MFESSQILAESAKTILIKNGIDQRADWRMLEYWVQVELFNAFNSGAVTGWSHLGSYEHPYFTNAPLSGSKSNYKWVDLLCASPNSSSPSQIVWLELKDVGRNPNRLHSNAWGLGKDLAALYEIDIAKTIEAWRNPPEWVKDAGRLEEWSDIVNGLEMASHFVGQIVIVEKVMLCSYGDDKFVRRWQDSWHSSVKDHTVDLAKSDSEKFAVFAIVTLPRQS